MSPADARPLGPLVAVTGLRGIPASWGGVERQCEELYARLASRGWNILVYARAGYVPAGTVEYRGARVKILPALASKYLEAWSHTFLAVWHMILFARPAIVHVYSQGPCLLLPLVRLFLPRAKVFFTCGGLDWQRRKWPWWASFIIHLGEVFSAKLTHCRIMVSKDLADYYLSRYGQASEYIANGVSVEEPSSDASLAAFGLAPGCYFLSVGRLAPEKRVEDIIVAFRAASRRFDRAVKLAVVGDDAAGGAYLPLLRQAAGEDPNVVFCGYRFGEELAALYSRALCFVTASDLEGMPLALLEAMGHGLPCLASDLTPHREVLGPDYAWFFPTGDTAALSARMDSLLAAPSGDLTKLGQRCKKRVEENFTWDKAASGLEELYRAALPGTRTRTARDNHGLSLPAPGAYDPDRARKEGL